MLFFSPDKNCISPLKRFMRMQMEANKISNLRFFFVLSVIFIAFSNCKKPELTDLPDFNIFKVYNDTLANAANSSVNIAAGNGRLFMTYGTAASTGSMYQHENKSEVMATDNEGNFLWKSKIPDEMEECALVALDDGGCLVATQYSCCLGNNSNYSYDNLYFFHYDKDGNSTKVDSVSFLQYTNNYPAQVRYIGGCKKSNGNFIFYGDIAVGDNNCNGTAAWAVEYSSSSGVLWFKTYFYAEPGFICHNVAFSGCVQTPDNGFLFSGNMTYFDSIFFQQYSYPFLVKTNSNGDTLWTKRFSLVPGIWSRNIVKAPNGNYRFCFNSDAMHIYEINEQGDSLYAVKVGDEKYNYGTMIIETNDGGCFSLVTEAWWNNISNVPQVSLIKTTSRKVFFDLHLNKTSDTRFQTLSTDFMTQTCMTSDGDIACFGLRQPIGKTYYVPQLYILK